MNDSLMLLSGALLLPLVVMGHIGWVQVRGRGGRKARLGTDHRGGPALRIGYSRLLATLRHVIVVLCLLLLGLFTPVWWSFFLEDPDVMGALLVGICTFGLICMGWCVFHIATGRLRVGFVALSPNGIWHRGWGFDSYYPWDAVYRIEASDVRGPAIELGTLPSSDHEWWFRRTSKLFGNENTAEHRMTITGAWLTVDPALLYHALQYYQGNPEARAELATEIAVRRFRAGTFPMTAAR